MKLLLSQKNQIFEIIENFDLSPLQFEMYDVRDSFNSQTINTKLKYKETDFYFEFRTSSSSSTSHTSSYSPGENTYEENRYPQQWRSQIEVFKQWLKNLKRELNAIDKWKRLGEEFHSLDIKIQPDNEKFNYEEVQEIESKIEILKDRFNNIDLLPEQLNTINQKLDSLAESAKNMNRFDWRSLFIGTIMSIIIQLNVTPDNAATIWKTIKEVFNQFLLH